MFSEATAQGQAAGHMGIISVPQRVFQRQKNTFLNSTNLSFASNSPGALLGLICPDERTVLVTGL